MPINMFKLCAIISNLMCFNIFSKVVPRSDFKKKHISLGMGMQRGTHWIMVVSRCMVECLTFYAFKKILYIQGSIAWSLENVWVPYFWIMSPVMPASWGVNQLATSHTVEQISRICLHSWSHDKPIFYLISHCLNKKRNCLEPLMTKKNY